MSWSMGGNMSIKTTIAKYGLGKMIDQLYEESTERYADYHELG